MIIDVGATSYEEVVDLFKIEVGAPVVPDTTFSYNKTTEIMLGKAFDNSCILLLHSRATSIEFA